MKNLLRRFSAHGDFWLRYLHWGTRHCPWFLEPMYVFAFTVMFWVFLGRQRRAVTANLAVLLPGSSPVMNLFRAGRVFWNFAWSLVDQAHARHGSKNIHWEIMGDEHLAILERETKGSVLLTAHMGNYDVAAPLFAERIQRPIHMVRAPEREQKSQEFQAAQREKERKAGFVVHYNEPGNMLGMDLARAIQEGGVVAIQGDRILFDVSPLELTYREGITWQIPRGPFLLALVTKALIHPVFIVRMGYRRYRVVAAAPIEVPLPANRDKEAAQRLAAEQWNAVLREVMERHWRQWFVFEPVFQKTVKSDDQQSQRAEAREAAPKEQQTPDRIIPAESGHGAMAALTLSALVGCWSGMVMLRWLLERSLGCTGCMITSVLIWPVLWFLAMVALAQVSLWVALAIMKLTRLPMRHYDVLACGITLTGLSAVAWEEYSGGCPVGWWLGVLWFVGLGVALIGTLFRPAR
ncbi:lysophospholipid acyltransferase family protein [Roseimicrobium gellanilyticum]|uniref:lysophospholipid acyltransferase family protein n=1 Tax=Roseimicrobium gellanilyticum TaxID=748857 RepID=UPI00147582AD|nr:lysophospholipid acyltransferase family protein [Roseimicrobium gellanilyticum]